MDILKPEDKTLDLLATELGIVLFEEKADKTPEKNLPDAPAPIKPFAQLT